MDYCIPHMLFFKCLILTEYSLSTRLLKELCVGHHSHISLKDLVANRISAPMHNVKVLNGESRHCTWLPNISFVRSWIHRKRGKKWNVRLPL